MHDSPYPCFLRSSPFSPFLAARIVMALHIVRVPVPGLPSLLSGEARASRLVSTSDFLLTRRSQAHQAPPFAQAPHSRRLSRLSTRLHGLVGWRASAGACASLERGEKPAGSSQTHRHRRFRLSQSPVHVLREH